MREIFFLVFLLLTGSGISQKLANDREYYLSAIGFWNVENLYDTLNDQWKNDEDFTPAGANAWNGKRYWLKMDHLATVISQIATDVTPDGLAVLGICEVENKNVIKDLINSAHLKKRNYQFIHVEGPDSRGVDPALIYNPRYFKVNKVVSYHVKLVTDSSHKTRDILVVSGYFYGEPTAFLVNHWPSRRGGEIVSRPNRNAAANLARSIGDSIQRKDSLVKIVIMGDLNDDPINESVKKYIRTYSDIHSLKTDGYFNPMETLYKKGIGTLAWQDSWNLFDQILLNKVWIPGSYTTWQYYAVRIFNKDFLRSDYGNFKGYPFRTYSGGNYTGGYSDHFPSYIIIAREKRK
jgi:hypothetical protein